MASAQNFARELMETPSNHLTPSLFVDTVNGRIGEIRHTLANPLALQSIPRQVKTVPHYSIKPPFANSQAIHLVMGIYCMPNIWG